MKHLGDVQFPRYNPEREDTRPMTSEMLFETDMPRKHTDLETFTDATGTKIGLAFREKIVQEF